MGVSQSTNQFLVDIFHPSDRVSCQLSPGTIPVEEGPEIGTILLGVPEEGSDYSGGGSPWNATGWPEPPLYPLTGLHIILHIHIKTRWF